MVRYDPATGRISGQNGVFLGVKLAALTADGQVPDDHTNPKASFSHKVLRRKVDHARVTFAGLRVKVSEGGQTVATLRYRGKIAAWGLITRDDAGSDTLELGVVRKMNATLRRAAADGRRAIVHLTVHDWAGNKRIYDVPVRLTD
jgi:hypothetical protein